MSSVLWTGLNSFSGSDTQKTRGMFDSFIPSSCSMISDMFVKLVFLSWTLASSALKKWSKHLLMSNGSLPYLDSWIWEDAHVDKYGCFTRTKTSVLFITGNRWDHHKYASCTEAPSAAEKVILTSYCRCVQASYPQSVVLTLEASRIHDIMIPVHMGW